MLYLLLGTVKSPRVPVEIEGREVTVLLDTGAEVSVLPKQLMTSLIGLHDTFTVMWCFHLLKPRLTLNRINTHAV